jgi:hypothetical protein
MKIRWTHESVRLRITPTELTKLTQGRPLRETLNMPGGGWDVRVVVGGVAMSIHAQDEVVVVELPSADVALLADPAREGVYAHTPQLRLLVEKDFPCAHPHAAEAAEPPTERFAPTPEFVARKSHAGGPT